MALTVVVGYKGYHSNEAPVPSADLAIRSYVSEPARGRRRWWGKLEAHAAVYANRGRIRGACGLRLLRRLGERLERFHAHLYETGRLRWVYLRGHTNLKRLLECVCGLNLGLLMRHRTGVGTPRSVQGRAQTLVDGLIVAGNRLRRLVSRSWAVTAFDPPVPAWIAPTTPCHRLLPLALLKDGARPLLTYGNSATAHDGALPPPAHDRGRSRTWAIQWVG